MMALTFIELPVFAVIGVEASSEDGAGFVARAWDTANARFSEVAHMALADENGAPRIWGLMSDMSRSFRPWEDNFTKGLYIAGIEVAPEAQPPAGWTKWVSPAYRYAVFPMTDSDSFARALEALTESGLALAGAAYDRIVPGKGTFIYMPVAILKK